MAEINDAELAELRQAHGLLKALHSDGKVGIAFKKLVKEKFPQATIPELDALAVAETAAADLKKTAESETGEIKKMVQDFLAGQAKEREEAKVADFGAKLKKIVKDRGYTEDGEEKILGIMKDRGITDPEDAAIIFEARLPKPVERPRAFTTRMDFISPSGEKDEAFQRLMADPEQFMADELMTAIGNKEQ
jgi:hypothetical protein